MLRTLTTRAREDRDAGFTLIEILVAMVLMAIVMSSLAVFFIGANKSGSALRMRQNAAVVADEWMDKVHSVDPGKLLTKRGLTTSTTQWSQASTKGVDVSGMTMLYDKASTTAGTDGTDPAVTPLPDVPQAQVVNNTPYQISIYIGQCYVPSGGGDCVTANPTNAIPMDRVVVAVNWTDHGTGCPNNTCAFVVGSLISTSGDPTFNVNQVIIDTTAPSTPTLSTCSTLGDTSIKINNWSASTDASSVARYDVYEGTTSVFSDMVKDGTTPGTGPYTDTGLIPSTTYYFVVVALDTVGNQSGPQLAPLMTSSPPEPPMISCTTAPDTTKPSAPSGLTATSTSSSVTLNWTAGTDDYKVGAYNIYRGGVLVKTVTAGTVTWTDTGLSPWTNYTYTVETVDLAGGNKSTGNPSTTIQTKDTTPPTAPLNLTAVGAPSSLQITLDWTDSTDDVAVTGYKVWRATASGGPFTAQTTMPTTSTYVDTTGLSSNLKYWYYVVAYDAAGNASNVSNTASATTPDTIAPNAPTGLTSPSKTGFTVSLSWTAATDVSPGTGVVKYNVYRGATLVGSPTTTSFTDTGLTDLTSYSYTVKAVDGAGNISVATSPLAVTTPDGTPPTSPTLSFSTVTLNSIQLNWTAATDNVGVTGYAIYRNGGTTPIATTTGTTYTYTNTGLTAGTAYTYTVKAYDTVGNYSVASNVVNPSTLTDTTPPAKVLGLKGTSSSKNTVTISWTASTDNVAVVGYRLYWGATLYTVLSPTVSQAFSGLTNGSTVPVTVYAYDAAGNSSPVSATLNCVTGSTGSVTCT